MKRRFLAGFLSLIMVLTAAPVSAMAADTAGTESETAAVESAAEDSGALDLYTENDGADPASVETAAEDDAVSNPNETTETNPVNEELPEGMDAAEENEGSEESGEPSGSSSEAPTEDEMIVEELVISDEVEDDAPAKMEETAAMKNVRELFETLLNDYFYTLDTQTAADIIAAMDDETLAACNAQLAGAMDAYDGLSDAEREAFDAANMELLEKIAAISGTPMEMDEGSAVAKVNDTDYSDISEALNYWKSNGGTLTLLAEVSITTDINSPVTTVDTEATLNLNGKTLKGTVKTNNTENHVGIFNVGEAGKLTITDTSADKNGILLNTSNSSNNTYAVYMGASGGTLTVLAGNIQTNKSVAAIQIEAGGTTTEIRDGTIESKSKNKGTAIKVSNGILNVYDGNVGGDSTKVGIYAGSNSVVNITGGVIKTTASKGSNHYGIQVESGELNVTGGDISGTKYGIYTNSRDSKIKIGSSEGTADGLKVSAIGIGSGAKPSSYAKKSASLTLLSGTVSAFFPTSGWQGLSVSATPITKLKLGDNNLLNYLPTGLTLTKIDDAYYVDTLNESNAAASLKRNGDTSYYITVQAAANAMEDGDIFTLLQNTASPITLKVRNAIVDLNNKSVTVTGASNAVSVDVSTGNSIENGVVTIKNGNIAAQNGAAVYINSSRGTVTLRLDNAALAISEGGTGSIVKLENGGRVVTDDTALVNCVSNPGFTANDGTMEYLYGIDGFAWALNHSDDGANPVKLFTDITSSEKLKLTDNVSSATLDLNGHVYTYTGAEAAIVFDGTGVESFTVTDSSADKQGKIVASNVNGACIMMDAGSSNKIFKANGITFESAGTYVMCTNATETAKQTIELEGCTLKATGETGVGIYFPTGGNVKLDNCVITAPNIGVQMCAGMLTVTGDDTKITTSATDISSSDENFSGPIPDGAAISLVSRNYPDGEPGVSITEGAFTSADAVEAIQAYVWNSSARTKETWSSSAIHVNISGGDFSTKVPEAFCATGYIPTEQRLDGTYSVVKADYTLSVAAPSFGAVTYGYSQPAARALTITNKGNTATTIASVVVDKTDYFTINGSGDTVETGASIDTWTIQPKSGLSAGTYTATVTVTYKTPTAEDANATATATCTVSFTVSMISQSAPSATEAASAYTTDYVNETITAKPGYEISTDGGKTWTSMIKPVAAEPGSSIQVRKVGGSNILPSSGTTVTIASRPAAPANLTAGNETVAGANDGTISGVLTTMEYSSDNGTTWTKITESMLTDGKLTGLAAGTYLIRLAATEESYVGTPATVTIAAGKEGVNTWETPLSMESWNEGETAKEPNAKSTFGSVSYTYYTDEACTGLTTKENSGAETEGGQPTKAGTYYVKATVAGTSLYNGLTDIVSFTISHVPVTDEAKEATCTEDGLTEGSHCAACGEVLKKQETIKAEGHSYGSWKITKSATRLAAGEKQRTCSRCKNVEKVSIAKLKNPAFLPAGGRASGSRGLKIYWEVNADADGYEIFEKPCNETGTKFQRIARIEDSGTTSYVISSREKTTYQYIVKAYKMVNGKQICIAKSAIFHVALKSHRMTNAQLVNVNQARITLKAGQTFQLSCSMTLQDAGKSILTHVNDYRYYTMDGNIATVSANGLITAKTAGTCKLYAVAPNGRWKTIKVTVK